MGERRRYERQVSLPTAMVTATVHENNDGTVFLYFENEHGEYGVTMDVRECAELRATLAAAEASAEARGG